MTGSLSPLATTQTAFAGFADVRPDADHGANLGRVDLQTPGRRRRRRSNRLVEGLRSIILGRGFGALLVVVFLGSVGAYGVMIGGGYDRFVAAHGEPADVFAKAMGFGVNVITISGQRSLSADEALAAAAVTDRHSLLFLDALAVRERLMATPLIKDARVRKLYPGQLVIELTERDEFALWQSEGQIFVVAQDGKAIDVLRDERFIHLPFVVGEGANERVAEFQRIVDAAGDFKSKIRAGVLVTNRRWNVKLVNGVDVKLPELNPEGAIASLAKLARTQQILDKDIISIDMRVAGRIAARLGEEAAGVRAEAQAKKPVRRGAI